MDNRSIAQLLYETADLLEISAGDPFRIRSYRRAAEAVESSTIQLSEIANDPKKLQEIPGIGKGMAANIQEIEKTGTLPLREELLTKYRPGMLDLLRLPGMGPKSVALFWEALQISSIAELEAAIAAGKLGSLPRMGTKQVEKLRKGIEDYKKNSGRFLIDDAEIAAEKLIAYLRNFDGMDVITPAGSLRRGRETVGDLDILVTGRACAEDKVQAAVDYTAAYPPIVDLIAKGQNKVSFRLRGGLQVDVRLLPENSYGAALQYFTGSKMHNVSIRQRALKRGYTLSEYSLARVEDGSFVARATEEEIYAALGLDDERALEHIRRIREVNDEMSGRIRIFAGMEVDILADGQLDLSDETLAQLDIVIVSVHSLFNMTEEEMTARILRAIENPYTRILGLAPPGASSFAAKHIN